MNALFLQLGLAWLKPFATALLLPPVPFLALSIIGVVMLRRRRRSGLALALSAALATWLSGCIAVAQWLAPILLALSPVLDVQRIDALRREAGHSVAIIILGGGVEQFAPEYGAASLRFPSLERLRFGLWLGRQIGWPVGFTGGIGWGQPDRAQAREATVAQHIATDEFKQPLRWVEDASRDTRENAILTARMLKPFGIRHVLLVTHAWHMARARRNFERAFGDDAVIEAAPIGLATDTEWAFLRWTPSGEGFVQLRNVVREWLGTINGA